MEELRAGHENERARTPSTDSSGACPDLVGSTCRHGGARQATESHYDLNALMKSTQVESASVIIVFTFIFGVILNSDLNGVITF